jgi:membrane-bound lytic murein transglycosylase A
MSRPVSRAARRAFPLLLLALAGCVPTGRAPRTAAPPELSLGKVSFADLPGWQQDRTSEALTVFLAGCAQLTNAAAGHSLGGQGQAAALGGQPAQWQPACTAAAAVPPGDDAEARRFFETYFQPYAVSDATAAAESRDTALFTGYFDPEVRGSRKPGGIFRNPLLGRPPDLVQADLGMFDAGMKGRSIAGRVEDGHLVPYYDRAQIDSGILARRRLELLWLADPVDVFMLQVQGSGRVDLPDGHVARVTYAGQNGRPYVPIGRVLADRGQIPLDQVSLATIRGWLKQHPDQAMELMEQNPSYVFFREVTNLRPDQGPPGALGVPLAPMRSIAVDRAFIPLGAPVYIATTDPLTGAPLQRLTLAQDLGGAIRGPARVDIFFGWGEAAEERAGRMRAKGHEYLLLPRPVTPVTAQETRH